jgi:hypothetical protein
MDLNGLNPGVDADQLVVSGAVTLTGANLVISQNAPIAFGSTYFLINDTGTAAVTGTFNGLPQDGLVTLATVGGDVYTAHISYTANAATGLVDGSGNDVALYGIIPAPGTMALLGVGGLMAMRRRRAKA